MAEKKNENEMNVTPEQVTKTEAPENLNEALENQDAVYDPFSYMDENTTPVQRDESETIYHPRLEVFKRSKPTKNGKVIDVYAIGMIVTMGGKDLELRVDLAPSAGGKAGYDMLAMIFGDLNRYPLEIVRTVTTFNDEKITRYTLQVTGSDDSGASISCPLVPAFSGGRVVINNIISVLRSRGEVK